MFHRKCQRIRNTKTELRQGASLVIVVCVAAFLVAFALAMVYTAGLMLAQANKRLNEERCYQLARSFARALDAELAGYGDLDAAKNADSESFFLFSCKFLEEPDYAVYNPDHPETVYHYKTESPAGAEHGTIAIALYKESDRVGDKIEGIFDYDKDNPNPDPLGTAAGSVNHYTFTVEVTAGLNGVSYSYRTVYNQTVAYRDEAVSFKNPSGTELTWDKTNRKWKEITGNEYIPADDEQIRYEIVPGYQNLKECKFTKLTPEKGEQAQAGGEGETP